MKKLIGILFFAFIALFISTKTVNAACTAPDDYGVCPGGYVMCNSGQCCDTCPESPFTNYGGSKSDSSNTGGSSDIDATQGCSNGINTAIGCINVLSDGPEEFIGQILKWAVGVGGGIAFLLIIYASFMVMTSGGNPERLKAGQELLTSAISGVILLVLSVFILRFIGVDILKIPGFGSGN